MPVSFKQRKAQQIVKEARKTLARKRSSVSSTVSRSLPQKAVEQAVRRAISRDTEQKFVSTDIDTGPIVSSTGTNDNMICVNAMQQGTDQFNRIGNKIKLKSVRIRCEIRNSFTPQAASGNVMPTNIIRCILLWCKNGGATPVFDAIFGETSQTGGSGANYQSLISPPQNSEFRILRDKMLVVNPSYSSNYLLTTTARPGTDTFQNGDVLESVYWDEFVDLSADTFRTTFNGTANPTTPSEIVGGALYVIFRASQNTALNSASVINTSFARLRYEDA